MKTLKNIIGIALLSLGMNTIAQTAPPAPPAPPRTVYQDATTTVTTNSSNVSVVTQSGSSNQGGNTSFSMSDSNDEYRVKSRYPKNRYQGVKDFLLQEMGKKNMQSSGTSMVWSLDGDEDTVFRIELDEKRLNVELDKTIASQDLISKFKDMGPILRALISGNNHRQEVTRLERDAERARRDAERMQREAERLHKMADRNAALLDREAQLLTLEAEKLSLISKRGGGIDGYVRDVLNQSSTIYQLNTKGNDNWKWPAMQKALLLELKKDHLINENEDVVFIKEDSGIYVNGKKLNTSAWSRYNSLFRKYDYASIDELSFYMKGDHIVIVDNAVDLEDLLDVLVTNSLIKSTSKKTKIEINGASIVVDGNKLSSTELGRWNALLHTENIIPAPGKTIIIGDDFLSIGYSFGKKTLGSWMSID